MGAVLYQDVISILLIDPKLNAVWKFEMRGAPATRRLSTDKTYTWNSHRQPYPGIIGSKVELASVSAR